MKRTKKYLLLGALTLLAALCLAFAVACGGGGITFKFETYGGPKVSSMKVEEGLEYVLPEPDAWADHFFEGWYLTEDFSGEAVTSYKAEKNTTFYAKWSQFYTVTLDAAGGTLATTSVKVHAGAKLAEAVAEYVPTKAGYQFDEWYYGNDPVGADTLMPEENIKLTAHYMVGYTVHVYLESANAEGTYEQAADYVGYARATGEAFTVTYAPEGYEITEHTGDLRSKVLSATNPAENVFTVYYNRKTVTLTFHSNDSQGLRMPVSGKFGEEIELTAELFTRSGYLITGWSTEESGADPIPVTHEVYNKGSVAPTLYKFTEDTTLYAVWQQGYVDIFGGIDNIYFIEGDIYLYRAGFLFVGEHIANNLYIFTSPARELYCRVYENGTFCYEDESREGAKFYLYDMDEGTIDADTFLQFTNSANEVAYVENASRLNSSSYGTYYLDDYGYMHVEFTSGNGSMVGKSVTMMVSYVTDKYGNYYNVFMLRNEEEYALGTLSYLAFDGEGVVAYEPEYLGLTLDGFGNATLSLYGQSMLVYYMTMHGEDYGIGDVDILYLMTTDGETLGLFVVMEVYGVLGFTEFDYYTYGDFISDDGSTALSLDGTFNATYYGPSGREVGYYSIFESYIEDTMVIFIGPNDLHLFVISADGTLTEYSQEYNELLYFSEGDVSLPILVMGKEEGKFELYTYDNNYMPVVFAEGTLLYYASNGTYAATITEHYYELGEYDGIDFDRLASFIFTTSVMQTGSGDVDYVMIWNSYTLEGDDPVNAEVTYKEAEGKGGTIVSVKGFAYYTPAGGDTYIGLLYQVSEDGFDYWVLYSADGTFCFEIKDKTFTVLDSELVGSAYLLGEDGMENTDVSLVMDGKGNATYSDGKVNLVGKVNDTDTVTVVYAPGMDVNAVSMKIYHFKANDGSLEFNFIMSYDDDYRLCFVRENEYSGWYYASLSDDILVLDGYCYFATLITNGNEFIYGGYYIEELAGEKVICFLAYTDMGYAPYYFDVIKNEEEDKVVNLRGDEVGEVLVMENQRLLDVTFFFDGNGTVYVYELLYEDSDHDEPALLGEGEYTKDSSGLYTLSLTYKDDASKNETLTGYFTLITLDDGYQYGVFVKYYSEVAYLYINPADWSVVMLDGVGSAIRISYNGNLETGAYIVLDDGLIFFMTDDVSDACIYTLNTTGKLAEINRVALEEIGYFTQDFDSLIFTDYGTVVYEDDIMAYYSYDADGRIVLYYDAATLSGETSNKYGYVQKTLDGVEDEFPATLTFNGKSFNKNDGSRITFTRKTDGTQNDYPIIYGANSSSYQKAPLEDIMFMPYGTGESYATTAYVFYTVSGEKQRLTATMYYEFDTDKEHSHYYLLIGSADSYYQFEIQLTYNGSSGSTYKILNMSVTTVLYSYMWALYYDEYYQYGYDLDSDLFGYIMLTEAYDINGNPTGDMKLAAAFGEWSDCIDHNGNPLAFDDIDCEVRTDKDSSTGEEFDCYIANFTIDGIEYELEFQIVDAGDYLLYAINGLFRTQRFTGVELGGELYDIEIFTLIASDLDDLYYEIGVIYDVNIIAQDGTVISDELVLLGGVNRAVLFGYDSTEGALYEEGYYVLNITFAECDNLYAIPAYVSVTLEYVEEPNYYTAYVETLGYDVWILFNGDEVELMLVGSIDYNYIGGYLAIEATIKNDDGSYTVMTSDGAFYNIVKGANGTATLTDVTDSFYA